MQKDLFDLESYGNMDLADREERCQKAIRTVVKAIVMRFVICGILLWIILRTGLELWVAGLLLLVMIINITGILPLAAELKKRRQEWKALLEEEQ